MIVTSTPKRTYKVRYEYAVPEYMVRCSTPSGYAIITKLIVTLEDEGTIYDNGDGTKSGPRFVDYDCEGYAATSKGQIDKRSKLESRFVSKHDHTWIQAFIDHALRIEGWYKVGRDYALVEDRCDPVTDAEWAEMDYGFGGDR